MSEMAGHECPEGCGRHRWSKASGLDQVDVAWWDEEGMSVRESWHCCIKELLVQTVDRHQRYVRSSGKNMKGGGVKIEVPKRGTGWVKV